LTSIGGILSTQIVDPKSDLISFDAPHGFVEDQQVTYTNGSGLAIEGLTSGDSYFVDVINTTTIGLTLEADGPLVDILSRGTSGGHTIASHMIDPNEYVQVI